MSTSTHLDIDLVFSMEEALGGSAAFSGTASGAESSVAESSGAEPSGAESSGTAPSRAVASGEVPSDTAQLNGTEQLTGTITATGLDVEIYVNKPEVFLQAASIKLKRIRGIAADLAERGLAVSLAGPDGVIVRLGAVNATVGQRILTGSAHIALGRRSVWAPLLKSRGDEIATDSGVRLPPSTLFPVVPTFNRRIRRQVTTTHHEFGSGRPRLIFVVGSTNWNGQKPREFNLLPGITTIGSSPLADLQLPGLEPMHAEIRHDANDEYVLHAMGEVGGGARSPSGQDAQPRFLRTGARIEMGQWRLGFFREEYADHGRPHGGRQGGELEYQKPQPGRTTKAT